MRQGNNSRRSRGRGNGKRQSRGNQIDSHGPEVRVRGTAQQVCDKYLALARDATSSGDRIGAENMFQHAEHYSRVLAMAQENAEQRNDNRDGGKSRHDRGGNGQISDPSQDPDEFESSENTQMAETLNDTPEPNDKSTPYPRARPFAPASAGCADEYWPPWATAAARAAAAASSSQQ